MFFYIEINGGVMTDKELLEYAAKAAGYSLLTEGESKDCYIAWNEREPNSWNPLTDDGDALRLAVKLQLDVSCCGDTAFVTGDRREYSADEYIPDDPYAATRRAIVRAAAEIGRRA